MKPRPTNTKARAESPARAVDIVTITDALVAACRTDGELRVAIGRLRGELAERQRGRAAARYLDRQRNPAQPAALDR